MSVKVNGFPVATENDIARVLNFGAKIVASPHGFSDCPNAKVILLNGPDLKEYRGAVTSAIIEGALLPLVPEGARLELWINKESWRLYCSLTTCRVKTEQFHELEDNGLDWGKGVATIKKLVDSAVPDFIKECAKVNDYAMNFIVDPASAQ